MPVLPVREGSPVDTERLEPSYFVVLRRQPSEGRPLDEVIEREHAPHEYVRRRVLAAPMAHVGDAQRPIERFAGEENGARAASRFA